MNMNVCVAHLAVALLVWTVPAFCSSGPHSQKKPRRNVIIFVVDGLRPDSLNATDAPTLLALREHGVNFVNSHSLFPTFTTPNAAANVTL